MDIFLGHHKIGLYLGVISIHFRVFSCQGTEWGYFLGLLKFQIFLVVFEIPDIFWGVNGRCWKKLEYPSQGSAAGDKLH